MSFNTATIAATFFAYLATDTAGAGARATLGGAASIIPADKLKTYNTSLPMPARVLAAFRVGEEIGNRREGQQIRLAWWLYDDETYQYARISATKAALEALYPDEDAFGSIYLRYNGASQEAPDPLYKMPCRKLTWTAYTRQ